MYKVSTLSELNSAVNRDEPEIKIVGDALTEYRNFSPENIAGGAAGAGIAAGAPLAVGGAIAAGPIGLVAGLGVGAIAGAIAGHSEKKSKDKELSKKSCDDLRWKISNYYRKTGFGNSYVILKHK